MILLLLASTYFTWRVGHKIRNSINAEVEVLTNAQRLEHYGVILEMSIKAVVAHGDAGAAAEYRKVQPKLRSTLTDLRSQVHGAADEIDAAQIDRADLALVAMEYQALDLVSRGEVERARRIINSKRYDYLVDIYVHGIRGIEKRAEQYVAVIRAELNFYLWLIVGLSAASLILIILGWFALIRPTRRWGRSTRPGPEPWPNFRPNNSRSSRPNSKRSMSNSSFRRGPIRSPGSIRGSSSTRTSSSFGPRSNARPKAIAR